MFSFAQLSSILESIPEADRAQAVENVTQAQVELAREKTRQMQLETAGPFCCDVPSLSGVRGLGNSLTVWFDVCVPQEALVWRLGA